MLKQPKGHHSMDQGEFSTKNISVKLISKIIESLKNKDFGSVEIFVENYEVSQITDRTITKVKKSKPVRTFIYRRNTLIQKPV